MKRNRLFLALLFSILLHLFLLGLGATFSILVPPEAFVAKSPKSNEVDVTLIPKGMQIADIAPPAKEETPDQARFLGEYDSRVKEETVSPSRRSGGGDSQASKGGSQTSPKSSAAPSEEAKSAKLEKPLPKGSESKEGEKLAMKTPEKSQPRAEKRPLGGEEDYFNGFSEDFFPDYKIGDHTYLNVLKYPKIGYFVRMKKAFRTTFDPVPALRSSFAQVSRGEIDVVLAVSVDRMGKLAELKIIRSSGIDGYDREAVRTVRASAPFAVPPGELLDKDSMLLMAWTFTVYL